MCGNPTLPSTTPPLKSASLWSRFWFAWNRPLLALGSQRPLTAGDLPPLDAPDTSRYNQQYIQRLWKESAHNSLAHAMACDYFHTTWKSRLLIMLNSWAKIGQAMALGILLESLEQGDTQAAYTQAGIIIVCGMIAFPTKQHSFFELYRQGNRYRAGLQAAIYAKTLRLPSIRHAQNIGTPGHVTNLASNDVERFVITSIATNLLLASPIEICTTFVLGVYTMGPVFGCGYALLVLLVPLQFWLSRQFVRIRQRIASRTDARVNLVAQAVSGARLIKLQAWEIQLEHKIAALRDQEVQQLQICHQYKAWNDAIHYVSSLVVAVSVLGIHVGWLNGALSPRIVFTTFTLWNLLQYSVTKHIPHAITGLSECYVACQRIQAFLELPEQGEREEPAGTVDTNQSNSETTLMTPVMQLSEATCIWEHDIARKQIPSDFSQFTIALDKISLSFEPATLYCVIGKVGSGKSALLQTLIGELPLVSGSLHRSYKSLGYAAQDPWIMDGTARENILMGQLYDPVWYEKVVQACCLESDFYSLLQGDQTIVGDRGVQLSGGQKARLALARAFYRDPQVLILDDPLSAVDAKVARSIYYFAIEELGVRRGKCVVLVTHQHQFVGGNNNICILLDQGKLVCCGSFAECVAQSGGNIAEALQTLQEEKESEEKESKSPGNEEEADECGAPKLNDDKDRDGSFVEKRNTGVISSRTWFSYGEALGGFLVCGMFFFVFSTTQAIVLVTMTYVGRWAEAPAPEQNTAYWFSIVFGLTAGTVLLAIIRAQMSFYLFLRASKRLHNTMLRSVLRATVEFYDTNPLGRILNRFAADVGICDELLPLTIYEFGVGLIMFMGTIFFALVILPLALGVFPFLLWAFVRLRNIFVKTTRELKRLEGLGRSPIYAMMSESLIGVATIRSNDDTIYFLNKYENLHDTLIRAQFAFLSVSRWFATQLDFLSFIFLTVSTVSAVVAHDQGWFGLDPAVIGLALSLLLQLAGTNFPYMVRQSAEVTNHMVSVERIWEFGHSIPQEAPFFTDFDKEHKMWPIEASIVCEGVKARYRENLPLCLNDISFTVRPGERVGVVGRTGAGKTSLLQALFRVLEAEDGVIRIGGVDISRLGLHKLRTNMAVITQSPVLFSGCTIRENLDPYPSGKQALIRLENALRSAHMWDSIQSIPNGVDGIVAENGSNFSVGQRQLLCLARALLADCQILVLDEATANVDQATDNLLQKTLRERFASATILAIAHRLDTIMDYDKVLVLGNGRVLEFGSPAALLKTPDGVFTSMVESTGSAMADCLKKKVQ